jgi:uncharacterized cupin superfamily protein
MVEFAEQKSPIGAHVWSPAVFARTRGSAVSSNGLIQRRLCSRVRRPAGIAAAPDGMTTDKVSSEGARRAARPSELHQEDPVVKPVMNLDEVVFDDVEENGLYTSSRGQISDHIGAAKLGYNLTVLPPGKAQCPFHCHHGEEEMFLILEGEGELRFGDKRYPIRKHDVIACPTGGADTAHQIINTGTTTMRYLALSNIVDVETCEYPDSQKILVAAGRRGERGLRKIFRAESTVDYYDRERTDEQGR